MRRDPTTARLSGLLAAAGVAVVVQLVPWIVSGAVRPDPAEVAVGAALLGSAAAVFDTRRPAPSVLLTIAAATWLVYGFAPTVPDPASDVIARSALLPHALLVAAIVSLPEGRLHGARVLGLGGCAVAIGIAAGTGLLRPALLLLGVVALAGAVRRWRTAVTVVQVGLGLLLALVDIGTLTARVPVGTAGDILALGMVVAAASIPLLLERERGMWLAAVTSADPDVRADAFGARLGRALGTRALRVAFPAGAPGRVIDFAGEEVSGDPAAAEQRAADGQVLAYVSPGFRVDPLVADALVAVLERAGQTALLRARLRENAAQLAESQRLLVRVADEERAALEHRVNRVVAQRMETVARLLRGVPGGGHVARSAALARDELSRFGLSDEVTDLHEVIPVVAALAAASGAPFSADIPQRLALPHPILRAAWYACIEGVVNAVKHAPGATIRIRVSASDTVLSIAVSDNGPGGANPDGGGLLGLADRADAVGGSLDVTSTAAGTRVEMTLPVRHGNPVTGLADVHDAVPAAPFLASMS